MKTEERAEARDRMTDELPNTRRGRRIAARLFKLSVLVGVPLLLMPLLLPRKASAGRLPRTDARIGPAAREPLGVREKRIQDLVDALKERLSIPDEVVASIVERNDLVVSVTRGPDEPRRFALSIDADFIDGLTGAEIEAVVAHELGHVWIFTHHPYLQTEEQANRIAMQVVSRDVLEQVYEKVWARTGGKGDIVYLPAEGSADVRGPR